MGNKKSKQIDVIIDYNLDGLYEEKDDLTNKCEMALPKKLDDFAIEIANIILEKVKSSTEIEYIDSKFIIPDLPDNKIKHIIRISSNDSIEVFKKIVNTKLKIHKIYVKELDIFREFSPLLQLNGPTYYIYIVASYDKNI